MKIAVTGGSGFIGRGVISAAVQEGHTAWPFDRAHGDDVLEDLSDLNGSDTVIHLAGMLGTDELFDQAEEAVQTNIIGTLRVLEWCRENRARYVGITMPPVFPSVYTATKVCAQSLADAWRREYGVPVSHVRAFNAYGPGQAHGPGHPRKILPTFARAAWEGKPIPIWGDGEQTVDLVHASDVGRMLVAAAHFGDGEVFDAGCGIPVTVNELAQYVLEWTGSRAGVAHHPMRRGEVPTRVVAEGEGWNLANYRPVLELHRVKDTVLWYRDRPVVPGPDAA